MPAAKPAYPRLRRGHPLAQGLVAGWPMYEGGGLTLNDRSGQGNNGTLTAGASWVGGQSGWALNFNGSTGCVDIPNRPSQEQQAFTIACWLKSTQATLARLVVIPLVAATSQSWSLNLNLNGAGIITLRTSAFDANNSTVVNDGRWWHIVASNQPGVAQKVYTNGVLEGTSSAQASISYANHLNMQIGRFDSGAGQYFNGALDGMVYYNRALSQPEVAALYADSFQMFRRPRFQRQGAAPVFPVRPWIASRETHCAETEE